MLDWENFKDLQLAFLKASTPDSEIPTDNIIHKSLFETADKYGIKYVLSGYNMSSESILPLAWSQGHLDKRYIKAIHKHFGTQPKLKFSLSSVYHLDIYRFVKKLKIVNILDYIDYDKEKAKETLQKKLKWQDYGRKHGESIYTKIFQEYILPVKFGFDKRRAHLSSLIVSGQLSRKEAIKYMDETLYANNQTLQRDIEILCDKFEITKEDFEKIMNLQIKFIHDYPNEGKTFRYKLYSFIKNIVKRLKR